MVCYIILHYQVENETVNCVNQIKQLDGDHQIVIVDNCSPNGSGRLLEKRFDKDPNVDVIMHYKNDGFARGNNVGCKYAKEKYNPDFYVVMNNDIEISQRNFESLIFNIFDETGFDILGPDIYSTSGKVHQSPKSLERTSIEKAIVLLEEYRKKCDSKIAVPIRCYVKKIKMLKIINNKIKRRSAKIDSTVQYKDVPLHGSCVIFSNGFMNKREEAFFPETFFYYEMEILDYESQINGYSVIYDPRIKVVHHQNTSTNATFKNDLKRVRFMNEQNYKSINSFVRRYGAIQ